MRRTGKAQGQTGETARSGAAGRRASRSARAVGAIAAALILALCPAGAAPADRHSPGITELRHTRWTLGDGAPGSVRAITQGRDGFLWLGTSTGLYRFDGIRFEHVPAPDDGKKRSLQITALLAARNGDIWVGYDNGGIALLRDGVLRDANPWKPEGGVDAIVQSRDGAIWVSADSRGELLVSRLKSGRWSRIGPREGYVPGDMGPIFAARDGSVYLSAPPAVLRMRPGAQRFERVAAQAAPYGAFAQDPAGTIWFVDDQGLRRLDGTGPRVPVTGANTPFARRGMYADRSGHLWISAQDDGLMRFTTRDQSVGAVARMSVDQGLTSALTLSAFEDREGNVWIGTASGLDRFTPANVGQTDVTEGLVSGFVRAADGKRLFIAGLTGIYRIDAGSATPTRIFAKRSIGVLCGDDRHLLMFSLEGHALLTLDGSGSVRTVRRVGDPLSISCVRDGQGRFWTGRDRLYQLIGSQLVPARGEAGEKKGSVVKLRADGTGGVLFSRPSTGFRRVVGTRETALWPRSAPTIGAISTLALSGNRMYAGAEAGIGRWDGRRFANLRQRDYPFLADITGILPARDGSTWMIGVDGILRLSTKALDAAFDRPGTPLPFVRFGYYENFAARAYFNEANDIASDASGRIWFATNKGLAYVDPRRISRNTLPPGVVIRSLTAAGRALPAGAQMLRLPAGTDRLQIDYTALSLTDARANRFHYKLEGDRAWTDAQDRRQAVYTNLGPGTYRFHVIAANNDGVWNEKGASLSFSIAPRFYQTRWFAAACVLALIAGLWLLYRSRLRIVADRARAGIQAQVGERERIARELHDTLLQGFQGLMLRFQAVIEKLPPGSDARAALEDSLERADDILVEGRDRVRALRAYSGAVTLRERVEQLAGQSLPDGMAWSVDEEKERRLVSAAVAEEVTAIIAEALANGGRHSNARHIAVHLAYGADRLTISVRDDGIGIPADILDAGRRDGHYGLIGMHERAQQLGGTLMLTSSKGAGTLVTLTVPARIAYS